MSAGVFRHASYSDVTSAKGHARLLDEKEPFGACPSHRQRQNLLVELTDSFGSADRNSEQIGRKLADAGAAFCGHFAQSGIHGCVRANLDLLARTFMRLGHAAILAQQNPCTWYRHAVA